jgi:hypothetical protein
MQYLSSLAVHVSDDLNWAWFWVANGGNHFFLSVTPAKQ